MKLNLDGYEHLIGAGPFVPRDVPAFAGISGGRTSGMMAALLDPRVTLCFQNTGEEDDRTLLFLERLEDALERTITWLEFRPPVRLGAPPREFGFEIVTPRTATRQSNVLFVELLRALNAYRKEKGEPAITVWARMRLCTAYLKHRTMEHWIKSLGVLNEKGHLGELDWFVGLRADEPDRVSKLRSRERGGRCFRAPLDHAGIAKLDVNAFWKRQAFDLTLDGDYQGNCSACYLKDEADISRALGEDPKAAERWLQIEDEFPGFGGHGRWTYRQLIMEHQSRTLIEAMLRNGVTPVDDKRLTPKRFKLVVRQEERRLREGSAGFTCACEQTIALADDAEGDEE